MNFRVFGKKFPKKKIVKRKIKTIILKIFFYTECRELGIRKLKEMYWKSYRMTKQEKGKFCILPVPDLNP